MFICKKYCHIDKFCPTILREKVYTMRPNRSLLLSLFFVVFIDWMSVGLVYPLFSSIAFQETAFFDSDALISRGLWMGLLVAACPLAQFFSAPFLGSLSDKKGRSSLLTIALSFIAIGYFISTTGIVFYNLLLLLAGQLLIGTGCGNIAIVSATIADISSADEKAKNFGLISMANGLGFAFGPFFGGVLAHWGSLKTPFFIACLMSLLNLVLVLSFFPKTLQTKKVSPIARNFKQIFSYRVLYTLLICLSLCCIGWSLYWEFISVSWIKKYGLNAKQIGFFYGYGALCFAASSGLLVRPLLKFSGINMLVLLLTALGCSIFPLIWSKGLIPFLIFIPLQQYLLALLFPVSMALISNMISENEQGGVLGVVQSIESLAFAITPLFAGSFVPSLNHLPMSAGGCIMFLAATILFFHQRNSGIACHKNK